MLIPMTIDFGALRPVWPPGLVEGLFFDFSTT
jgi:hypothetical protein